jgi:adenylate cyclase
LEDIFELQDQVALSVAGVIEPTLQVAEIRRAAHRPTSDPTAYDLYLRAVPLWASHEKERIIEALGLLALAIERDPQYGPALGLAALCHQLLVASDWTENSETYRRESVDLARRALRCSPDDPDVLANAAVALGSLGEDIDVAIGSIDRSLALNPSFARGWVWSARLRNYAGQPDLAIEHFEASLRLSPRDRMGTFTLPLGAAYFLKHEFATAAAILLASLEQAPGLPIAYQLLAACYAHMGRLNEAQETVIRLKTITPAVVPSIIVFRKPEHRELFLSGLRLAAGEKT